MNNSTEDRADVTNPRRSKEGKIKVKFFWKTSLILSIALTIIGTIVLNLIIGG